jgi:hypothetical protein
MKSYYRINIDTSNAVRDDVITPRLGKYLVENFTSDFDKIFKMEWFDELSEKVGKIKNVLIFSRPAHWSTTVSHVDLKNDKTPVWFSLNWIITGNDSEMIWHQPPDDYLNCSNLSSLKTTMSNNYNLQWKVNELEIVDRCKITDSMVLARTDIPHSIIVKSQPRIAIAIRPINSINPVYNWNKSVEFYREKNLIIND